MPERGRRKAGHDAGSTSRTGGGRELYQRMLESDERPGTRDYWPGAAWTELWDYCWGGEDGDASSERDAAGVAERRAEGGKRRPQRENGPGGGGGGGGGPPPPPRVFFFFMFTIAGRGEVVAFSGNGWTGEPKYERRTRMFVKGRSSSISIIPRGGVGAPARGVVEGNSTSWR